MKAIYAAPHRGGIDPARPPAEFWTRPDVTVALAARDMGALFAILRTSGVSRLRLAMTVGLSETRIGAITHGRQTVIALHTFERIANGLQMPDHARLTLGIAPSRPPAPAASHETGGAHGTISGRST